MPIHATHIRIGPIATEQPRGVAEPLAGLPWADDHAARARQMPWWAGCRCICLASLCLWVGIWRIVTSMF